MVCITTDWIRNYLETVIKHTTIRYTKHVTQSIKNVRMKNIKTNYDKFITTRGKNEISTNLNLKENLKWKENYLDYFII